MPKPMPKVLRVVGLADGRRAPQAGQWVVSYDPDAADGRGFAEFTADPARARRFRDIEEAMLYRERQSKAMPTRPDGKPNRPLTAFTMMIEDAPPLPRAEAPDG